jgi:hypothetical protein
MMFTARAFFDGNARRSGGGANPRGRMLVPMRLPLHTALLLLLAAPAARAQTADPAAAPPSPATTAPVSGTGFSVQNGELIVAPGLRIPNGNVPWALDTVNGKQVLVPVHHAALPAVGEPTIDGASSKTPLHSASPVFFVHTSDRTENTGDSGRGVPTGWALLPAEVVGATRKVERPRFSDVNGATVCVAPVVCTTAESLPDGWLRIVTKSPLAAGEYALLPVPRTPATTGNTVVYDFTIDGGTAKSKDEVSPGQNLDKAKHKKR